MITVKNFDTLLKLPSTPKEGDLAYIEEPKGNKEKVFCYMEGKWTPVNPDGEVKANLYDINATAIAQLPAHNSNLDTLKEDVNIINDFANEFDATYFSLLCRKLSNGAFYNTIFHRNQFTGSDTIGEATIDCLCELGTLHAVSVEENHIEFWVKEPDNNMICLLFFTCDSMVVEVL